MPRRTIRCGSPAVAVAVKSHPIRLEILKLLESGDPGLRRKGLESIRTDTSALQFSAMFVNDSEVRLAAVESLSNPDSLFSVMRDSKFPDSSDAAHRKLEIVIREADKGELLLFAQQSPFEPVRTVAVEELVRRGDFDTLGYVSLSSGYDDTKELAKGYLRHRG